MKNNSFTFTDAGLFIVIIILLFVLFTEDGTLKRFYNTTRNADKNSLYIKIKLSVSNFFKSIGSIFWFIVVISGAIFLIKQTPNEVMEWWQYVIIIFLLLLLFIFVWIRSGKSFNFSFFKKNKKEKTEDSKKDEKVGETKPKDSSKPAKTEKKKISWKWLWWVLLVLFVYFVSLFFWKDGPWGVNHLVRKVFEIPFTVFEGKHFKKGDAADVYIEPGGYVYYQADISKGPWEIEVSNPDYSEDGSKKYGSNTPKDPNKKLHYGNLHIVFLTDARDFAVIANKR